MGTNDQKPPLVVCDAAPLIHLDEVGCLDLLADFSEVLVPDAVWQEVQRHRPSARAQAAVTLWRVSPLAPEPPALEALAQMLSLHTREWQALPVAQEHPQAATDEAGDSRRAADTACSVHPTFEAQPAGCSDAASRERSLSCFYAAMTCSFSSVTEGESSSGTGSSSTLLLEIQDAIGGASPRVASRRLISASLSSARKVSKSVASSRTSLISLCSCFSVYSSILRHAEA